MQVTTPPIIPQPFANGGEAANIPDTKTEFGRASWNDGFPTETALPLNAGGIPPNKADFNGVLKAISQHTFFGQSGCLYPWDATLNYLANAHVVGSDGNEYAAKLANGPDVSGVGSQDPTLDTDGTYWANVSDVIGTGTGGGGGGGGGVPTGTVVYFGKSTVPDGYLVCNGGSYSSTTYADLYGVIGTTFGGTTSNFKVPNLIDKVAWGNATVGTTKSAGLPNIEGTLPFYISPVQKNVGTGALKASDTGASIRTSSLTDSAANYANNFSFNASLSNSIYGSSTTVQPPALTLLPCIKY